MKRPHSRNRVNTTIQALIPIGAVRRRVGLAIHVATDVYGASQDAIVATVGGAVNAAVGVLLAAHAWGGTVDVVACSVGAGEDAIHPFVSRVDWRVAVANIVVVGGDCGDH